MSVYHILLGAILGLGAALCLWRPSKQKNIIYLVVVLGYMWALATFRYGIGFDYFNYIIISEEIAAANSFSQLLNTRMEIGFVLLTKLITMISSSPVVLYGIYSFLILVPVGIFIYRYSPNVWLSLWLYVTLAFFYTNMNFIRQSLACSIFILGYDFLRKKKLVPYLLITLLAASFHKTALIMIPIYFLVHITLTKEIIIGYSVLVVTGFLLSDKILNIITQFIFTEYADTKYILQGFSLRFMLVPITALILCASLFVVWRKRDPDAPMLLNLVIISTTIWLFSLNHMIIERFSMYNYIFLLIAIPSALAAFKASPEEIEERDRLAHKIENARGTPMQQDITALKTLTQKITDHRTYYWSAVVAILIVTLIYNSFGMHVNGFHEVFPYQSIFGGMG